MCIIFMISSATQPNFHCIIINTQCLFSLAHRGEKPLDYPITGSGGWGQLPVRVWLIVRIIVQYALWCATNLSEVLLRHEKEEKKNGSFAYVYYFHDF